MDLALARDLAYIGTMSSHGPVANNSQHVAALASANRSPSVPLSFATRQPPMKLSSLPKGATFVSLDEGYATKVLEHGASSQDGLTRCGNSS